MILEIKRTIESTNITFVLDSGKTRKITIVPFICDNPSNHYLTLDFTDHEIVTLLDNFIYTVRKKFDTEMLYSLCYDFVFSPDCEIMIVDYKFCQDPPFQPLDYGDDVRHGLNTRFVVPSWKLPKKEQTIINKVLTNPTLSEIMDLEKGDFDVVVSTDNFSLLDEQRITNKCMKIGTLLIGPSKDCLLELNRQGSVGLVTRETSILPEVKFNKLLYETICVGTNRKIGMSDHVFRLTCDNDVTMVVVIDAFGYDIDDLLLVKSMLTKPVVVWVPDLSNAKKLTNAGFYVADSLDGLNCLVADVYAAYEKVAEHATSLIIDDFTKHLLNMKVEIDEIDDFGDETIIGRLANMKVV